MNCKRICLAAIIMIMPLSGFSQTLKEALNKRDTVTVLALLKNGEDINAVDNNGTSLLMDACRWANDTSVSFLLRHGATADMPKSPKGRTPLMIGCAYYAGKGIARMLIMKGANVNAASDDGSTPLMLAAMNAKVDVVELLLDNGAKADVKNNAGKTALDIVLAADINEYIKKAAKDTRVDKDAVVIMLQKAMK